MGHKILELTLMKEIEEKNVYVSAYLSRYPTTKKTISGNSHTLRFTFDEVKAVNGNWYVMLKLKRRRRLLWDKLVGEVRVSLKDLDLSKTEAHTVTYKIQNPSSSSSSSSSSEKGQLELSCKAYDKPVALPQYPPPAPPVSQLPQIPEEEPVAATSA